MKQCEICNITFDSGRTYSNHVRWVHKEIKYKTQICKYCNKNIAQCAIKRHQKTCNINKKNCKFCNAEINSRSNIFCNNSCSASYNNINRSYFKRDYITIEWKNKQSLITRKNWAEGKLNVSNKIFSSKNEREIISHFKNTYPEDEWKSGGRLKLNNIENLSRDMWSDKLKICFEYDGVWHFKDIHHQLAKKQLKDALLEQWCLLNNYRLIRVDEDFYINIQQIEELIYKQTDKIMKIGNRY